MAGTRTVPTIDGTASLMEVAISFVDNSGDYRTVSFKAPQATSPATVEALVTAMQNGSRASIYKVEMRDVYIGVRSKTNAEADVYEDTHDNFVWLMKDDGLTTFNLFLPSPIYPDLFDASLEQPDPTDPVVSAITTAINDVWGSVTARSIRFSKRSDAGKKVDL